MKQITLRDVSAELSRALREEQRRRGLSLNRTVLQLLYQALGLGPGARYDNGLGKLAGRWSEEDLARFEADTAPFEQVDEELWK